MHTRNHTRRTRGRGAGLPAGASAGFTLIELIVAVSLTLLMMLLVSNIFDQSRRAIARGTGTGDVNANSRNLSSQLVMDFDQMVGPQDNGGKLADASGGYLVITQQNLGDWGATYGVLDGDTNGDGRLNAADGVNVFNHSGAVEGVLFQRQNGQLERRHVRTDQISFIARRGATQQPIAPGSNYSFSPHDDGKLARYVRVWYGHVARLERDGTEFDPNTTSPDDPTLDGHLGRQGANLEGNRFIVGRQALFLGETAAPLAVPAKTHPVNVVADGARWISPYAEVLGSGGTGRTLYRAFGDYANFSFDDTTHAVGSIVGASGSPPNPILDGDELVMPANSAAYHANALANLTFVNKRLRVNPQPDAATWESWRVAQMHPYLMEYASDFAVEFAGDYFTGDSDPTDSTLAPDGRIDTGDAIVLPPAGSDPAGYGRDDYGQLAKNVPAGHIKWYTAPLLANHPDAINGFDSTKPLTYPWPWPPSAPSPYTQIQAGVYNPMYDARFAGGAFPHADFAFVFRHDDERDPTTGAGKFTGTPDQSSLWPYLIRLRYRLHDPKGELDSGLGQHGVWFEQVVPVARPNR